MPFNQGLQDGRLCSIHRFLVALARGQSSLQGLRPTMSAQDLQVVESVGHVLSPWIPEALALVTHGWEKISVITTHVKVDAVAVSSCSLTVPVAASLGASQLGVLDFLRECHSHTHTPGEGICRQLTARSRAIALRWRSCDG